MADSEIITKDERKDYFISENGLELKLKKVSRFLMAEAGRTVKAPKVPVVYIADKERDEENPNDPDYLAAVQDANFQRVSVTYATILAMGTEVVRLPSDMEGYETDDWIDTIAGFGITDVPRTNKRLRYAAWLKFIAIPDGKEFEGLITKIIRFSGLTVEEDVTKAEETFRDQASGATDTRVVAQAAS